MSSPRILITGFQPFLGESLNPSEQLLSLTKNWSLTDKRLSTLLLPVTYADAFPRLLEHLEKNTYDYVVMLGQASGRSKISLERVALNWQESVHPDEAGYIPQPARAIRTDAVSALFSTLPLEEIKTRLQENNIPAEISFTAGAFVCNSIFFQAAHYLAEHKVANGFVHVPMLPEQAAKKPGTPSMPLEQMEEALKLIISCLR